MNILRAFISAVMISVASAALADTASAAPQPSKLSAMPFQFPALVSACNISARDEYFNEIRTLFVVFPVGQKYSLLYGVSIKGAIVGLADMHYDEGGFEAQGGVWSTARASDVFSYLTSKSFSLVDDDQAIRKLFTAAESCKIEYKQLKAYKKS